MGTDSLAHRSRIDNSQACSTHDGQTSSFLDEIGNDMDVKVEDVAQAEMNMNDMNAMDVEVEDVAGAGTCKAVCYKDKCKGTFTNPIPRGKTWHRIRSSHKGGCCFLGRGKCDLCCSKTAAPTAAPTRWPTNSPGKRRRRFL